MATAAQLGKKQLLRTERSEQLKCEQLTIVHEVNNGSETVVRIAIELDEMTTGRIAF